MPSQVLSHSLAPDDEANPMNWPFHRKIYTSACAWLFSFSVAFSLTTYTAGLQQVIAEFHVSMTVGVLAFTIYLMGIAFAPIYTPHVAERVGRSYIYLITIPINLLFILGASRSQTIGGLLVCRFFAGFFGGPSLVLIEGTFADIWSAETTNTYYAFLGASSYIGAGLGPLIGGFVATNKGWRWTGYVSLMIGLGVWLFGIGMSETYQREIPRRRARKNGVKLQQPAAQSGVTLSQMFTITVIHPITQLITEPIVLLSTLYLLFNWGVLFQWFITVPIVLGGNYNFSVERSGVAFVSAIIGSICAALTSIAIEQFLYRRHKSHSMSGPMPLEYRLIPALIGSLLLPASLFWAGWSAKPTVHYIAPITATAVYAYASLLTLISIVPYLFDAFRPDGTLSALTIAAVMRILLAASIPLCIVPMVMKLTGAWALSTFGFIGSAFATMPFALFFFGEKWRMNSKYAPEMMMGGESSKMVGQGEDGDV
ncbi:MFS general substrate transporter [Microthyrium microscopicum]|uniref:MFS general substrate transporter n=1 Tax=Microthyrium microscopicum TaxID=703497 RepID=A0A6A6U996_9PEZI|nr:MFS general substrate transporter [Microthyrium microscopicum]